MQGGDKRASLVACGVGKKELRFANKNNNKPKKDLRQSDKKFKARDKHKCVAHLGNIHNVCLCQWFSKVGILIIIWLEATGNRILSSGTLCTLLLQYVAYDSRP